MARNLPKPAAFEPPGPVLANQRILWLRFEGVDYFADVWLNEHYLGSHEGYFAAFQYEITPYLRSDRNLLAVRVDSPNDICAKERQTWQLKGLIKGALQRWDVSNPELNPGGIWNDVKLVSTGPGAITGVSVQTKISNVRPTWISSLRTHRPTRRVSSSITPRPTAGTSSIPATVPISSASTTVGRR